jgi:nicotinate-nucleotide pyrophosphorylase (carboxylating)
MGIKVNQQELDAIVKLALKEDIGNGDLTAHLLPQNQIVEAQIVSQQSAIICGTSFVDQVFHILDPRVKIKWLVQDGAQVKASCILCTLRGHARALLTGERTALNFLQTLSSTATLTHSFVAKIKNSKTKLLDTRKTIPGLRLAQKYAVKCGGGNNHRLGLYDAILIKENHIAACGSITNAVKQAYSLYPNRTIEVEVRNLSELQEALATKAKIIMLDNFSLPQIRKAIKIANGKAKLEISGGINLNNIARYAATNVDYISVGAITKTLIPVELSMLFF